MNQKIANIKDSIKGNTVFKHSALFAIFSFFNKGISFILMFIIVKFIDPEGYGYLNLFNVSMQVFAYFICLNSISIVSISFFRETWETFKKTINAIIWLTFICAICLAFITVIFNQQIERLTGLSLMFQLTALAICFFNVFSELNLSMWRIEEKVVKYGLYSCSVAIFNFILTIVFIVCLNQNWLGRIESQALIGFIGFIVSSFFIWHKGLLIRKVPSWAEFKECLKFGVPLIPHNISFWFRQGLDRYFINYSFAAATTGLFSFSYNFANIITILGDAFNASNSVFIHKNLGNRDETQQAVIRNRLRKQTIVVTLFFLVITVSIIIGSWIVIPIFFKNYAGSTHFILIQCSIAFFQCIYLQFVNFLFFFKKTKGLMFITTSVSVLHVVASAIFTKYSIFYTLYIELVSQILITTCVAIYSQKFYRLF